MISHGLLETNMIILFTLYDFFIYLLLYVDDMLIATKNMAEINMLKDQFKMKHFRISKKILGMKISRDKKSGMLYFSQN